MRRLRIGLVLVGLAGCDPRPGPGTPPEAPDPIARGEVLSLACQVCHSLAEGGPELVGPNLHGVFGRAAGSVPGFPYSDALAGTGLVWSEALLDRWLEDPAGFLPGTTMAFTGYRSAEDRAALIGFLVAATRAGPAVAE